MLNRKGKHNILICTFFCWECYKNGSAMFGLTNGESYIQVYYSAAGNEIFNKRFVRLRV